jgi:hypothetical protein
LPTTPAANVGYLNLAPGFDWLSTWQAFTAFAVAAVIEIGAYYVPWLDNLLDTIASPVAVFAGMVLFAASVTGIDPFLKWSLAIIAGGGSAAIVQGGTVIARGASTSTTGGLANFVISTVEAVAGFFFAITSIVIPLLAVILLLVAIGFMYYFGRKALQHLFAG